MLLSLGLDFQQAALEVRERYLISDPDAERIRDDLARRGASESLLVRTCNRVEIYSAWPDDGTDPLSRVRDIAAAWVGGRDQLTEGLNAISRARGERDAARHLFRVAAGLESQILGDIHILGQIRRTFRDAVETGSVGSTLHRLFESALRVGKKVRRETDLMAPRSGVGSEAARRAVEHWGTLAGRACVVVGCGKGGEHAARCLADAGADQLTIANRTRHRAEALAADLAGAHAADLSSLPALIESAEVVVVATSAAEPVVRAGPLRDARSRGRLNPDLLVIDVSVPRNVDPRVGEIPGVALVDLDSLHPGIAARQKSRVAAIEDAELLVEGELGDFVRWLRFQSLRGALNPLQEVLAEVCEREVGYVASDAKAAKRAANRIVARVMARPMAALKTASEASLTEAIGAVGTLFTDPSCVGTEGLGTGD